MHKNIRKRVGNDWPSEHHPTKKTYIQVHNWEQRSPLEDSSCWENLHHFRNAVAAAVAIGQVSFVVVVADSADDALRVAAQKLIQPWALGADLPIP